MVKKIFDSKLIRIASTILEWIIGAVLVVLVFLTLFQSFSKQGDFFGYRVYIVGSESMVPTYYVGDTLLIKETNIEDIEVGDSVTYVGRHEGIEDLIITHQLKKKEKDVDGKYLLHIKGIANDVEDPLVYEDQLLGKVVYKFVILSFLGKIVTNTYLTIVCITIPIVVLILIEIIKVLFKKDTTNLEDSSDKEEVESKKVIDSVSEANDVIGSFGEVAYSNFSNATNDNPIDNHNTDYNNSDTNNIGYYNSDNSINTTNTTNNNAIKGNSNVITSMKNGYTSSDDNYGKANPVVNNFSTIEKKIEENTSSHDFNNGVSQKVSAVSFDFNDRNVDYKIEEKTEDKVVGTQDRILEIQKKFDLKSEAIELPKVKTVQSVKNKEESFVLDLPKTKAEVKEMEEKKNNNEGQLDSIKIDNVPNEEVVSSKKTAMKIKEIDDFFNN